MRDIPFPQPRHPWTTVWAGSLFYYVGHGGHAGGDHRGPIRAKKGRETSPRASVLLTQQK